jgi:hypothetical protein
MSAGAGLLGAALLGAALLGDGVPGRGCRVAGAGSRQEFTRMISC